MTNSIATPRPIGELIARHRAAAGRVTTSEFRTGVSRRSVLQTGATTTTALVLATVGVHQFAGAWGASQSASPAGAATATPANSATSSCVALTPELTEGPYYVDEALVRRDITDDREGLPLALTINVIDAVACTPLADAAVEVWHCDARGYYSGVSANNPGSDSSAEEIAAAAESMFLRGVQITDADGAATFDTIYPGWYRGRTVHIHMKVHVGGTIDAGETWEGGTTAHTGQLFFDDAISDAVFETDAYANRPDDERTENAGDNILGDHGDDPEFLVAITQIDAGDLAAGYTGTVTVGVDPAAVRSSGMGGGPGGLGGPPPGAADPRQSPSPSASDAA